MGINSDSNSSFGGASFVKGAATLGFGVTAAYSGYSLGKKALQEDVFTQIDKNASKPTKLKGFLKAFAETVKKNPKTALLGAGATIAAYVLQKNRTQKIQNA